MILQKFSLIFPEIKEKTINLLIWWKWKLVNLIKTDVVRLPVFKSRRGAILISNFRGIMSGVDMIVLYSIGWCYHHTGQSSLLLSTQPTKTATAHYPSILLDPWTWSSLVLWRHSNSADINPVALQYFCTSPTKCYIIFES